MENNPERMDLGAKSIKNIHDALQEWYRTNARLFPWRETHDPFHVLVAEKLLQKTAARNYVIDIYDSVIEQYSTPALLSNAEEQQLRNMLSPLGLISRARELIGLSEQIVLNYQGVVPENLDALLQLKGVGDYIARAVLCFAYGHDLAIVDTNVARWIYRLYDIQVPFTQNPSRNQKLFQLAQALIPKGKARIHNWAVLDLCSSICLPRAPVCNLCPIRKTCLFGQKSS